MPNNKEIEVIFVSQITRAYLKDKEKLDYYTYRQYRPKSFWRPEIKEGFYSNYGYKGKETYYLMLVDGETYLKPCVKYQMSTGEWMEEYFNTLKQADEFFRAITFNAKVIERP